MVYQYVAYNESGEIVKGKLPAISDEAATELLNYAGYRAINLKPYVPFVNLDKLTGGLFKVKPAEIILLYRQLAMLLESGIDIVASLEILQEQVANRAVKKALGQVVTDLRGGSQLSAALGKHRDIFPPTYCRLLSVGEQSGDMETVLKQVADYMEKEVAANKETKNALMYPVITLVVTIMVVGILITFVLPSFGSLYSSLGVELPAMAKILINLGNIVQSQGMYLFLAVLVIVGSVFLYIKTSGGRYKLDKLVLKLPLVGRVKLLSELSRYCRSMSMLFRVGLPLTEAMPLVAQSVSNRVIARALIDVQQDMVKGEGLSKPMAKNKLFLPMMVQMVRVGEETGNLDVTLLAVARSYEAEAEDKIHSLIALIPPAMTLFMGLLIGFIAVTLMSAMTAMYGQGI